MSFYLSIIMKEIDQKKDAIKLLLKQLPLVCNNFYLSFLALPKLNPVRLIENSTVFQLPNEFEINCMDKIILFFQSLKEASDFLKVKELIQHLLQFLLKFPETGSLDIIVSFLVYTYMDYSYFIQSNSKDIEQIKLIFNEQNASELESYKPLLNCTTLQLIDSWNAHGIFLSKHFTSNQTLPEPEFLHLQNLFLQLKSFKIHLQEQPSHQSQQQQSQEQQPQEQQPQEQPQPPQEQPQQQPQQQPQPQTQPQPQPQTQPQQQSQPTQSFSSFSSFSNKPYTSKMSFLPQKQVEFNSSINPSQSLFPSSVQSVFKQNLFLQNSSDKYKKSKFDKSNDGPAFDFYS